MVWRLRKIPDCGTSRGYDYHTRQQKEHPCEPCRDAKKQHWKERRLKNKESLNAWSKAYRQLPERKKYELDSSKRRSGKFVGDYSRQTVLDVYGAVCYLCSNPINLEAPSVVGLTGWENGLHIDHVVPISRGGLDELSNVRPAHAYCNQIKGIKC